MKTKIILVNALIVLFIISVASTKSTSKIGALKENRSLEININKGLAMEDRDQFN